MKRVLRASIAVFVLLLSLGFTVHDAEAKRLGGGTSSGINRSGNVMNRQAVPPKPAAPAQNAAPTAPTPPAPVAPPRSPWMGMLGGLALGAGIGALLGHFGLGGLGGGFGGILSLLLIGVVVVFLVRMLMRRNAPTAQPMQYAGAGYGAPTPDPTLPAPVGAASGGAALLASGSVPDGFDVDGFVRQAKLNFVRLQAANDSGNMEDIRAFTTPEMYAEIQLQFQERGRANQQTDVVQLNAELLDLSEEATRQLASVRFSGSIRETPNAAPEAFDEVWHLVRSRDGNQGWVIGGIQQYA